MHRNIPQELDQWMWTVAESGDSDAIEQFGERYPQLRLELANRIQMVAKMKGNRPRSVSAPPLRLAQQSQYRPSFSRWAMVGAVCAAISVAFAGYTAVQRFSATQSEPTKPTPITASNFSGQPETPIVKRDTGYHVLPEHAPAPTPTPEVPQLPAERLITVKFEQIRLLTALEAIAAEGNVQLEIAPNMPDIEIGLEYRNQPVDVILNHLGDAHGFRLLVQGKGKYLIVPVEFKDDESVAGTPENGTLSPPKNEVENGVSSATAEPESSNFRRRRGR